MNLPMTDYTDLTKRLREPIIGDAHGDGLITSGRLAERLIRERGDAAAAIAALTAERDAMREALDDAVHMLRCVLAGEKDAEPYIRAGIFRGNKRQFYSPPSDLTAPTTGG